MRINAKNQKEKRIAAFFDMDNTLLNINSSTKLAFYMLWKRAVPIKMFIFLFVTGILYLFYLYRPESILTKHIKMLKGHSIVEYKKVGDKLFSNPNKYFRKSILDQFKEHKKKGHFVVVITQNYDLVAKYFTDIIKPNELVCTVPEIILGKFTGKTLKLCVSHNKSDYVIELARKYNLDLNNSYAYTDSIHDIKMLELVGNVYIVNRNPFLKRLAKKRNWNIIEE